MAGWDTEEVSEIREAAELILPAGWTVDLLPNWPTDDPSVPLRRVSTIAGLLPFRSHATIRSEEISGVLSLCWEIQEGADQIRLAMTILDGSENPDDLWTSIVGVTKVRTMDWWRRWTVNQLVTTTERVFAMQRRTDEAGTPLITKGPFVLEWTEDEAEQLKQHLDAGVTLAATPRRDRISDELLQQVADVYRAAHSEGRRPTQAVAAHFSKPRSTAGRWVGLARQAGFLRPADGPRGGEVGPVDFRPSDE